MNKQLLNIDFNKKYFINPAYTIKPDKTRAITTTSKGYETIPFPVDNVNSSFVWILNPVYAVIFSFFDGSKILEDTLSDISNELGLDKNVIFKMISSYFNNGETQLIKYMKDHIDEKTLINCNAFHIPKNFIIECNGTPRTDMYPKDAFYIKKELWEFDVFRTSSPIMLTLMVNNACVTNCSYCYANKKYNVNEPLSTEKIISLIHEANKLGVLSFELAGGEVLLHKDWDIILSELYKCGYIAHISTKMCLTEEQILKLKEIGISKIQISVDAWDSNLLQKILNVKEDYFNNLQTSLKLLEKHNFEVSIKSVITNLNSSKKCVEDLLNNLVTFKNINYISVAPGEYSLYKDFSNYKISRQEWDNVNKLVENYGLNISNCIIRPQGILSKIDLIDFVKSKAEKFNIRSACSGNFTSLYILPDGKVTICEELYWHPKFLIGNVNKQSIQGIWDSKEATDLFYLSQEDFHTNSACKYCPDFKICRFRRGVCWKMIFQAYGMDDCQLPDPRCPLAPPPLNECYR
jgi:radical SAM protein with 4Fe4S-binding SPASM domain